MRDVVPNGDDFRSRNYGAVLANDMDRDTQGVVHAPPGNLSAFWSKMARRIPCVECGAVAGAACTSFARDSMGEELTSVHGKRFTAAKRKFGKERK